MVTMNRLRSQSRPNRPVGSTQRVGSQAAKLEFRVAWRETAKALFDSASCDALKCTRRLADLVFEAQLRAASAPQRGELRDMLTSIAKMADKLAKLLDRHGVREFAPEVADVLAQNGA